MDTATGTTFWKEAIKKEMKLIFPAFKFQDDNKMPAGYENIHCHTVYNIKLNLVQKAWFLARGHQRDPRKESVYSCMVSCDSVRLALLVAGLNDLNNLSADIQNIYLNAFTKEQNYMIAGPEFGPNKEGWPVTIVRVLYGLQSSSARLHNHLDHLEAILGEEGLKCCKADTDVWLQPTVKPLEVRLITYMSCCTWTALLLSPLSHRL
jgi:hypothetical protein